MQKLVHGSRRRRRKKRPGLWGENVCRWFAGLSERLQLRPCELFSFTPQVHIFTGWNSQTLTLLFTSTALQSVVRRGCDCLKLRFIFLFSLFFLWLKFKKEKEKKKKRKSSAPLPADRGALVPGFFWCKKKYSCFVSGGRRRRCSSFSLLYFSPWMFFFFFGALRQTWERSSQEKRRWATRRVDSGVWVKFWNDISPPKKKDGILRGVQVRSESAASSAGTWFVSRFY